MTPALYYQLYGGAPPPRMGMRHNMIVPYGPYNVGDGTAVNLAVQNEGQWERLCSVALGRPDLATDPRFATNELRVRNRAVLEPLIEELLADDTRPAVLERLSAADVPFGALNDLQDLIEHPQFAARDRWFEVQSPTGPVRALADPFNLSGRERIAGNVPSVGEHTAEVRAQFSKSPAASSGAAKARNGRDA
jgi:itaconate CoA-transferase